MAMTMSPRVSVIVPAHNASAFLTEALDSILASGLAEPEVIVVDDGSTDDTTRVARGYGRGVRLITQPRSGSGAARNAALRAASCDLIAFLDADDVWVAGKSDAQLEVLAEDERLGLVFCDMTTFDARGADPRTYFSQRGFDGRCTLSSIFLYDMISTPTVILRRRVLDQVGLFDESLPIGQDTDLWFRIARAFPFACVNQPLVRRRFHQGNTTRNSRLLASCVVEIWGRHLAACIAAEPAMRETLLSDFAAKRWNHLFEEGCALLREGKAKDGRRMLSEAIGMAPLRARPYAFYLASLVGLSGAAHAERGGAGR